MVLWGLGCPFEVFQMMHWLLLQSWTTAQCLLHLGFQDYQVEHIISSTSLSQASEADVRARLTFLSRFGPDVFPSVTMYVDITLFFSFPERRLWPLIDPTLPLEDLVWFLQEQGLCRSVRSIHKGLGNVATNVFMPMQPWPDAIVDLYLSDELVLECLGVPIVQTSLASAMQQSRNAIPLNSAIGIL